MADSLVVEKEKRKKPYWITLIQNRIKKNKNFLGFISGATGTSKSWSGISICLMTDPTFTPERIIFSIRDLMKLINSGKVKSGQAILFDEAGVDISSRSWQSLTNKLINFLLQTFRHKNFILIFTSPYMSFLDSQTRMLFHAEFSTMKINYEKRTAKLKPVVLQYNARYKKFYYKYLRIRKIDGTITTLKAWNVPAPPKWIIDEYEVMKTDFTNKLNIDIERQLDELEYKKTKKADIIAGKKPLTSIQEKCLVLMKKLNDIDKVAAKIKISPKTLYFHIGQARKKGWNPSNIHEKGGHP